jgi:hypothetical protein
MVFIDQNFRKIEYELGLATIDGPTSPAALAFIKTTLESTQMQTLDDAVLIVINSLRYMRELFQIASEDYLNRSTLITAILIGLHILFMLVMIVIIITYYLRRLTKEYSKMKSLMAMIPNEIMNKNKLFKDRYLKDFGGL